MNWLNVIIPRFLELYVHRQRQTKTDKEIYMLHHPHGGATDQRRYRNLCVQCPSYNYKYVRSDYARALSTHFRESLINDVQSGSDSWYSEREQKQVLLRRGRRRQRSILASLTSPTNLPQVRGNDQLVEVMFNLDLYYSSMSTFWSRQSSGCSWFLLPLLSSGKHAIPGCVNVATISIIACLRAPDTAGYQTSCLPLTHLSPMHSTPATPSDSSMSGQARLYPTASLGYSILIRRVLQLTVHYARDSQERELIIKAAVTGSHEHKINKALQQYAELYDLNRFPSVLPPLDVLETDCGYCFIVQPRYSYISLMLEG